MKKILISLSVVAAVAAAVVVGTTALFSDTETSAGNIFTAGSIDLKVDHLAQTYNGVDCKTCSVDVYSSTATRVVAASPGAAFPTVPRSASDVSNPHSAWQNEAALAPAQWIWASDPTAEVDTTNNVEYTFENKFQWNGTAVSVILDLALASDNGYKIILNGVTIVDKISTQYNYSTAVSLSGAEQTAFKDAMVNGQNKLDIVVRNMSYPGGSSGNPAGLLFKLNVQRSSGECAADSAFQQSCRLWTEKNLGAGDTFFNFNDVKPGDVGTNVISLHVSSNDAYSCLIVGNKDDQENSLLSPEVAAGDAVSNGNPLGNGELSNYLNVFTWGDTNGNGVYDTNETPLGNGPLSSLSSIMNMDAGNGQFLTTTTTKNIGLAWCAGILSAVAGQPFSCDGAGMKNDAQSDSFTADLTAYAEQVRNNSGFRCTGVQLPPEVAGPASVDLLSVGDFAILSKALISDIPTSAITGNVGAYPITGAAIGVPCAEMMGGGKIYDRDGTYTGGSGVGTSCRLTDDTLLGTAVNDMVTMYNTVAGITTPAPTTELNGGNLGGLTLAPGVYKWSTNVIIPTNVTLSGGANDVWIFQIAGNLNVASKGNIPLGVKVLLAGGAQAKNVFWQVGGGAGATLGTYSTFNGTILSATQVVIQTGAKLNGRALAQTQVTLDANTVTNPY